MLSSCQSSLSPQLDDGDHGGLKLFRIFTPGSLGLLGICSKYFNSVCILTLFLSDFFLFSSGGPDLLEGHGANRHGADGAGGGPAVPVPAEHYHRGLHSLPSYCLLHHLRADLLWHHPRSQVGRRSAPF